MSSYLGWPPSNLPFRPFYGSLNDTHLMLARLLAYCTTERSRRDEDRRLQEDRIARMLEGIYYILLLT